MRLDASGDSANVGTRLVWGLWHEVEDKYGAARRGCRGLWVRVRVRIRSEKRPQRPSS